MYTSVVLCFTSYFVKKSIVHKLNLRFIFWSSFHNTTYYHIYKNTNLFFYYFSSIGKGRSAIAVIRVSGPHSKKVALKIAQIREEQLVPRKAFLKTLIDPENGEMLDNALFFWFPQPNSFTGEDSVGII